MRCDGNGVRERGVGDGGDDGHVFRIYMVGFVWWLVIETDLVNMCVKYEYTHNTHIVCHTPDFILFFALVLWNEAFLVDLVFSRAFARLIIRFIRSFILHQKTKPKTRNLLKNQLARDQRKEAAAVVTIAREK